MKKRIALAFIMAGFICIFYSGWEMWKGRHVQMSALRQAKAITTQKGHPVTIREVENSHSIDKKVLGLLEIPKLKKELPIVEGTSSNQLKQGVGHYSTSSLPGKHDQIVLSGHRDTVFQHFGELKKGDTVRIKLQSGTYTYIIDHTKIVAADDRTIIHSTKPKEELVLTTCYPFYYVGNAPKRYIIYAYPKTS